EHVGEHEHGDRPSCPARQRRGAEADPLDPHPGAGCAAQPPARRAPGGRGRAGRPGQGVGELDHHRRPPVPDLGDDGAALLPRPRPRRLPRAADRAGPRRAVGGERPGGRQPGHRRHHQDRHARRGRGQGHPCRRPLGGGHGRRPRHRRPRGRGLRRRRCPPGRRLRHRGERPGGPRPAAEAPPHRAGVLPVVRAPPGPRLRRPARHRRRGHRHLPHRDDRRGRRRPPGRPRAGSHHRRGHQLRRFGHRPARRAGADHRGPGDDVPVRRHVQPDRAARGGRLPVQRRRPALLRPGGRGAREHLRRRPGPPLDPAGDRRARPGL
ncbi:MAG: Sialic acid utilization regulator, RpiR family, partial [uncultured Friedmanniella sp.]